MVSVADTGISSSFKIKHSNYANRNNERIYTLSSWSYHALQISLTKQLHFFLPPISTFSTLMTVAEFTKIKLAKQQLRKRHFLLEPYTLFYGCVRTKPV